jgi:Zn-finger nucleic acid-binding protein
MQAETLNCPMCGAAAETEAVCCLYCNARLATVACPSCFAMMFVGSRHCPRCGTQAERAEAKAEDARRCPRCHTHLETVAIGTINLRQCARCGGLWVLAAIFEQICADREQQAAVMQAHPANATANREAAETDHVRYVPCPECSQLMNRINFARCSGVVIDVCKGHGTWFDREELQRVIEFIRAGGMSVARTREIEQLAEERRRLQQEQFAAATRSHSRLGLNDDESYGTGHGFAAGELLKLLLG